MRSFVQIIALTTMSLKPGARNPLFVILVSLLPASFVVVFHLIGGRELGTHALFGMMVVFATNTGVVALPQLSISYRYNHLQEMLVGSPVGPGIFALGMGLSRVLFSAPAVVIVAGILLYGGALSLEAVPLVAVVLLLTSFTGVMIGFALATLVPNVYQVGIVANTAGILLSVLPPIYYPLQLIPEGWRWLAMLVPTTHAAEALRLVGGLSTASPGRLPMHVGVLSLYAIACGLLVFRRMTWREA